jgi:hypothetical protein
MALIVQPRLDLADDSPTSIVVRDGTYLRSGLQRLALSLGSIVERLHRGCRRATPCTTMKAACLRNSRLLSTRVSDHPIVLALQFEPTLSAHRLRSCRPITNQELHGKVCESHSDHHRRIHAGGQHWLCTRGTPGSGRPTAKAELAAFGCRGDSRSARHPFATRSRPRHGCRGGR